MCICVFGAGHQKQVGPELFRVFYTIWKETEAEAQEVCIYNFLATSVTTPPKKQYNNNMYLQLHICRYVFGQCSKSSLVKLSFKHFLTSRPMTTHKKKLLTWHCTDQWNELLWCGWCLSGTWFNAMVEDESVESKAFTLLTHVHVIFRCACLRPCWSTSSPASASLSCPHPSRRVVAWGRSPWLNDGSSCWLTGDQDTWRWHSTEI